MKKSLTVGIILTAILTSVSYGQIFGGSPDPKAYAKKAKAALEKKDYDKAARNYSMAIRAAGDDAPQYQVELAKVLLDQRKNDPGLTSNERMELWSFAVKNLQRALMKKPKYLEARKMLAEEYWLRATAIYLHTHQHNKKAWQEFIEEATALLKLEPSNAEMYYRRGRAREAIAMTDPAFEDKAIADFQKATSLAPDKQTYWQSLADFQSYLKKPKQAEETIAKAIQANPRKAWPHIYYARFLSRQKKFKEALEQIQKAIELEPKESKGYIALGDYYIDRRDFKKASQALQKARQADSANAEIYRRQAFVARLQNDFPGAIHAVKEGLKVIEELERKPVAERPDFDFGRARAQLNYWLADILLDQALSETDSKKKQALIKQAEACHDELMRLSPNDPLRYAISGQIAFLKGDWEQAQKDLEKGLQRSIGLKIPRLLVLVYQQLGLPGRAERLAQQVLQLQNMENNAFFLLVMAESSMTAQYYDRARKFVDKALKAEPENAKALELKHALDVVQKKEESLMYQGKPDRRAIGLLLLQAESLQQKKNYDDALAIYRRILKVSPKDNAVLVRLISTYQLMGQPKKAQEELDKALKADPDNETLKQLKSRMGVKDESELYALEMKAADEEKDPMQRAIRKFGIARQFGKTKEAEAFLSEAEKANPSHPLVLAFRFREALLARDWAAAKSIIAKLPKTDPLRVLFDAELDMAKEDYNKAIVSFKRFLKAQPHRLDVRLKLADCYVKAGRIPEATEEFKNIVGDDHRNVMAMLGLARLLLSQGQVSQYRQWINAAHHYTEGQRNPEIHERWIRILEETGDEKDRLKAIAERQNLYEKDSDDLGNAVRLAELYDQNRQMAQAQQLYEHVYQNVKDKTLFAPSLADFYRRNNQESKARDLFQSLIKNAPSAEAEVDAKIAFAVFLAPSEPKTAMNLLVQAAETEGPTGVKALKAQNNLLVAKAMSAQRVGEPRKARQAWAQALALMKKAISRKPKDRDLKLLYCRQLISAGQTGEAITEYKAYLADNPNDTMGLLGLGTAYLQAGQLDESEKVFDRAAQITPNTADTYFLRSKIHQARGDLPKALQELRRAEKINDSLELKIDIAKLYEDMGQDVKAAQKYHEILRSNAQYSPAYSQLVVLHMRNQDWVNLESLFQQIHKVPALEKKPWFLRMEAKMWARRNQPRRQIAVLKKALGNHPKNLELIHAYLSALMDAGEYKELKAAAKPYLSRPEMKTGIGAMIALADIKLDPNSAAARKKMLDVFAQAKDSELLVMGNMLRQAFSDKGVLQRREALLTSQLKWQTYSILADIEMGRKQYKEAEADYGKALSMANNALAKSMLGLRLASVYERTGQYDKCKDLYQRILQWTPNSVEALNNLAYLYADKLNEPKKAVAYIEAALQYQPGDLNMMDTHAWILYKLGDAAAARKVQQKVIMRGLATADTLYHMGVFLEASDMLEGAEEYYKRALATLKNHPRHPLKARIDADLKRVQKKRADQ